MFSVNVLGILVRHHLSHLPNQALRLLSISDSNSKFGTEYQTFSVKQFKHIQDWFWELQRPDMPRTPKPAWHLRSGVSDVSFLRRHNFSGLFLFYLLHKNFTNTLYKTLCRPTCVKYSEGCSKVRFSVTNWYINLFSSSGNIIKPGRKLGLEENY